MKGQESKSSNDSTAESSDTIVKASIELESDDEEDDEEDAETIARMRKQAEDAASNRANASDGTASASTVPPKQSAAAHTYDKGYKKWESFDVDEALSQVEDDPQAVPKPSKPTTKPEVKKGFLSSSQGLGDSRSVVKAEASETGEPEDSDVVEVLEESDEERRARRKKEEADRKYQENMKARQKKLDENAKKEREDRKERAEAYQKKKLEDGFGQTWQKKQKKMRSMEDWDSFNVDEELDRIEDEDRMSRGLNEQEIRNEKILEIMQNHDLSETEKMEKCMHMVGHSEYKHEMSEEDKARADAQDLINKMQDPRYQARDKMHFLHEAYKKRGDPKNIQPPQRNMDPGKLAELQQQMQALASQTS